MPLAVLVLVRELGGFTFTVRFTRLGLRPDRTVDLDESGRVDLDGRSNDVDLPELKPDRDLDRDADIVDPLVTLDGLSRDVGLLLLNPEFGADLDIPCILLIPELFVDLLEIPRDDPRLIDWLAPRDEALDDIFVPREPLDLGCDDDDLDPPDDLPVLLLLDAPKEADANSKSNTNDTQIILRTPLFVPAVFIIRLLSPAIVQA
jgi:hypothetical protein